MDLEALVTDELRADETQAGYALEWFEVEASNAAPAVREGRGAHARRRGRRGHVQRRRPRSTRSSARSTPPPRSTRACASSASTPSPAARTRSARSRWSSSWARPRTRSSTGTPGVLTGQRVTGAGQAVATDIIHAAAIAYVRALGNAVVQGAGRRHRRRAGADAVVMAIDLLDAAAVAATASELVRVPSVTGDERAVLERAAALAAGLGLEARLVRARPRGGARAPGPPGRGGGARTELLTLRVRNPAPTRPSRPRLALCAHLDVVAAGAEPWSHGGPWSGAMADGFVYGPRQRRHEGRRRGGAARAGGRAAAGAEVVLVSSRGGRRRGRVRRVVGGLGLRRAA